MEKKYREIRFESGESIESAIERLKYGDALVCGSFNGKMLYSDIDDLDSAFKKVTGKTKAECDEEMKLENEKYKAEKKKHEDSIPELTKEWTEKGEKILDSKYMDLWREIVPIRLSDLYRGYELGLCLEIIKELNSGCELSIAKNIIENQGHSGMSYKLTFLMVRSLSDRGVDFVNYINK